MTTIADDLRQRTFRYTLRITKFCRKLPETWEGREFAKQLLRAGMGTAANYWSACRGRSGKEFVARLGIAADEAAESAMWLMLIIQSSIRADEDAKALLGEGKEITAILSKSHKTAKENRRRKSANRSNKALSNPFTN